jgi:acetyl-CoA synthetase
MDSTTNNDLANIVGLDKTDKCYSPALDFVTQANVNHEEYVKLKHLASHDDLKYWAELARKYVTWNKEFTQTFNTENPPFYKWFEDGELSVSYNCLDRHLASRKDQNALIAVSDGGAISKITYGELHERVCKFANAIKLLGVKKGDRVILYLPNTIEAIVAIHACVRIGAIHSVVFGGFSARALADRIDDTQAKLIITGNWYRRGGKLVPLKHIVNLPQIPYLQ